MAPTVYNASETGTKKANMRKPVVEKMRRDRINRCIEQLKVLLETEIKASRPCGKLEKADILEMAVIRLKKSTRTHDNAHAQSYAQSYADGLSRCIQETARFLSVHDRLQTTKCALMGHFDHTVQPKTSEKVVCNDGCHAVSKRAGEHVLWRPW